jgi:hypothetical protein
MFFEMSRRDAFGEDAEGGDRDGRGPQGFAIFGSLCVVCVFCGRIWDPDKLSRFGSGELHTGESVSICVHLWLRILTS